MPSPADWVSTAEPTYQQETSHAPTEQGPYRWDSPARQPNVLAAQQSRRRAFPIAHTWAAQHHTSPQGAAGRTVKKLMRSRPTDSNIHCSLTYAGSEETCCRTHWRHVRMKVVSSWVSACCKN